MVFRVCGGGYGQPRIKSGSFTAHESPKWAVHTGQTVPTGSLAPITIPRRLRRSLGRGGWGGRSLHSSAKAVRDGSPSLPSGSLNSGPLVSDPIRQRRAAALSKGRAQAGTT